MPEHSGRPIRGGRMSPSRPTRDNFPGRRRTDHDPRVTVTGKVIAGIVFAVNALYLAGDTLLFGLDHCP
jgi:hypothetical protein